MTILSSFEVIAQPIAPGVPNVPFVQQGTFVQITNYSSQATINLYYDPVSPKFQSKSPDGALTLFANYIDGTGKINQYPSFLSGPYPCFSNITIPSGQTFLFGVQYIFTPPASLESIAMAGGTPQSSLTARGALEVYGPTGTRLLCAVTVRQVFNNYSSTGQVQDVDESAYSLPVVGGPLVTLSSTNGFERHHK